MSSSRAVRFRVPSLLASLLTGLLLLTPALFAQSGDGEELSVYVDQVDVNVVDVEVRVVDRSGEPVTGLTAEDFAIYDDGEEMELSNFFAVDRRPGADLPQEDATLAEIAAPEASSAPTPDQVLHLMVYVDSFNLRPSSRNRLLNQLDGFLADRVSADTRVMLMAYDRRLRVITPFTEDLGVLRQGVDTLRSLRATGQLTAMERRSALRNIQLASAPNVLGEVSVDEVVSIARNEAAREEDMLAQATEGLARGIRALGGLPGRKALLYVSDGLARVPGQEVFEYASSILGTDNADGVNLRLAAFDYHRPEHFERVVHEANAQQVTLYTLDARGETGGGSLSAENPTLGAGGGGLGSYDALRGSNISAPLIDMAERTGGEAFRGTDNFDGALAELAENLEAYYSLGYRSPHPSDGELHKIEVRVRRPGLRVIHRSGYIDKAPADQMADRTLATLLQDPGSNPLAVGLDVGNPEKVGRGQYVVPLIIRIPARHVTLVPKSDQQVGRLSFFVAVRDAEGETSDVQRLELPLAFGPEHQEQIRSGEIAYRTNLRVETGAPTIAVGVWDEIAGTEAFVTEQVFLGKTVRNHEARLGG